MDRAGRQRLDSRLPLAPKQSYRPQVAALPVRKRDGGQLEVMLVTSRETRRWVLPKGWPMKGKKDHQAARCEALEEAGVKGQIEKRSLGSYTYAKRFKDRVEPCCVVVYRLDVEKELETWPEQGQRTRQWFLPAEAAGMVLEHRLATLIGALGETSPSAE